MIHTISIRPTINAMFRVSVQGKLLKIGRAQRREATLRLK
jgi:hypothetical protein